MNNQSNEPSLVPFILTAPPPRLEHLNANYPAVSSVPKLGFSSSSSALRPKSQQIPKRSGLMKNSKSQASTKLNPSKSQKSVLSHSHSQSSLPRQFSSPAVAPLFSPASSGSTGEILWEDEISYEDPYDVSSSLSMIYQRLLDYFPITFEKSPHSHWISQEFYRISSCLENHRKIMKKQRNSLEEAERVKEDALWKEKDLRESLEKLRFPEWGNREALENSIKRLENEIVKLGVGAENLPNWSLPSGSFSCDIEALVWTKFSRLESLIFVLKKKLSLLLKYPHQEAIEKEYGSLEGLLQYTQRIKKENEILRKREMRFSTDSLLKRRLFSHCQPEFLFLLIEALQNEIGKLRENAKLYSPLENRNHPFYQMLNQKAPTILRQGSGMDTGRFTDRAALTMRGGLTAVEAKTTEESENTKSPASPQLSPQVSAPECSIDVETLFQRSLTWNPSPEFLADSMGLRQGGASLEEENRDLNKKLSMAEAKISSLTGELERLKQRAAKLDEAKENSRPAPKNVSINLEANNSKSLPTVKKSKAPSSVLVPESFAVESQLRSELSASEAALKAANARVAALDDSLKEALGFAEERSRAVEKCEKQRDQLVFAINKIAENIPEVSLRLANISGIASATASAPKSARGELSLPGLTRSPSLRRSGSLRKEEKERERIQPINNAF